ncbi:MAG: PBECR2 nuclease fold domain-containing protein [Faecalibacterium sp.]
MDVKQDVNFVCRLDREIYKVVTGDIASSEVIITDVQLQHIRERHPDISETVKSYLSEAILQPDYIIETDRPNTANILKRFTIDGKGYQLVLRLRTSNDPAEFKNSIITFMSVNEKRWNQYLRNRKILYKHE